MDIHHYIHYKDEHTKVMLEKIFKTVINNNHLIKKIMSTQAEVAAQLTALSTQLDKALAEIQAEIQKLTDAVAAAGNSTPEVDAALGALSAKVQALDDLNADPSTGGTDGTTEPTP